MGDGTETEGRPLSEEEELEAHRSPSIQDLDAIVRKMKAKVDALELRRGLT